MHDVIVVGAGPGGATAAYFLAQQGIEVLLLDKATFPRDKTCGDGVLPRALDVFRDMGLLSDLERLGARLERVTAFAAGGRELSVPLPRRGDWPGYALVVPRYRLDHALLERARSVGAQFVGNGHVVDVRPAEKHSVVVADVENRRVEYYARLVVIATGASTALLKTIGLLKTQPRTALAVRAYYDNVAGLTDGLELHFADIHLPGYAWVFPTSPTSANVGAGCFPGGWGKPAAPPKPSLHTFLTRNARTRSMLRAARMTGSAKGFPLRIDFARAPTHGEGVLLVGEAAGLVNPISGDGIDLAAETGRIAAEHIPRLLKSGDRSAGALSGYGAELRHRYQAVFLGLKQMRDLYMNPWLLNRAFDAALKDGELRNLIMEVALGQAYPAQLLTFERTLQILKG